MSLVGWWRFDGDFADSHNSYDAIAHGSPSFTTGKLGQALDLTGNTGGSGAELLQHVDAEQTTIEGGYSLWFKSTTTSGDGSARIIVRDASEYPSVALNQGNASGSQSLTFYGANSWTFGYGGLETGRWYHLAMTWSDDGGRLTAYLDGKTILDESGLGLHTSIARPVIIGGNTEGDGDISGNPFVGQIDDVRVFDHFISQQEAVALSQAKIGHWKLNGTANDCSGYDYHGTNNGATPDSNAPIHDRGMAFTKSGGENIHIPVGYDPQQFTISCWANLHELDTTTSNDYRQVIRAGSKGNFVIVEENSELAVRIPGMSNTHTRGGSVPVGSHAHLAATYDQNTLVLYVDGVEVARKTIGPGTVTVGGWLEIAIGVADEVQQLDGVVSNVQFYATPLSADAIKRDYENRASLDDRGNFHAHELIEAGNALQEPGFETDPPLLRLVGSGTRTTTEAYEGDYSLRAVAVGDSQWKEIWYAETPDGAPLMNYGETWTMSFWAKSTNSFGYSMGHAGGGGFLKTYIEPNSDWTYYEVTDTIQSNSIGFQCRDPDPADGEIFIDNVEYTPGPKAARDTDFALRESGVADARGFSEFANTEMRQQEHRRNYIGNGLMEDGNLPENEYGSNNPEYFDVVAAPDGIGHPLDGTYVLQFSPTGGSNSEVEIHPTEESQPIGLSGTFTLSCWAYMTPDWDGDGILHSRWIDSSGTAIGTTESNADLPSQAGEWQRVSTTFDSGATEVGTFNWYVGWPQQSTAGNLYLTGFQVEYGEMATAFGEETLSISGEFNEV